MKKLLIPALALGSVLFGAASCDFSQATPITAAICTDAGTLSQSSLKLNSNQTLALNGIIATCNATQGGTVFNNTTAAVALINDAILLQGSGLLSNVHIKAEAPEQQLVLRKIRLHWERYLQ